MLVSFQQTCADYLTDLRALRSNVMATDELSLRPALDRFLNRAAEVFDRPVQFIGEGKKVASGKPDFIVTHDDLPIGYVEAEAYGVDLDNLTGHAKEQNDRFRANLDNFLLTNHLEFRLYVGGERVTSAKLPAPPEKGAVKVDGAEGESLSALLEHFLQGQLPTIASPRDLALHLARRARQMRNEVQGALVSVGAAGTPHPASELHGDYEAFKQVLLPDLTEEQFADMFAQTIAYGLFAARCAAPLGKNFTRQSAADLVPKTNPFLRKLFQRVAAHDLDEGVAWIADDTAQLLAQAPIGEILSDFGKRTGKEDPVVHFYETFLAAYDAQLREVRGVYYTPEPVVSYIVRSLDHLLKSRFNKPMGLADEKTLILDPATGTGSFLFAVVNQIRETVSQTIGAGAWSGYVENHLLPRLFGFELLVAPYAVAHLKLGLLLQDEILRFAQNDKSQRRQNDKSQRHQNDKSQRRHSERSEESQRVGIYLTNTLEEALKKSELLLGKFISDEANEAADIKKERPILVVLGNPPYSYESANKGEWIISLVRSYYQVDGQPLGERNPKGLQDDYVKFIRFAQWRIEKTGEGVIGYITNHGYLDNPTFRGMRQSLMQTFNEIYVLNLHGNAKKKERAPDGSKDENVFDIQQGVAILLCVKRPCRAESPSLPEFARERSKAGTETPPYSSPACIYHADLYGVREDKYKHLAETDVSTTQWTELQPSSPFYLFIPQDTALLPEYEMGWKVTEIFQVGSTGLFTSRDALTIHLSTEEVWQTVTDFVAMPPEAARMKYNLGKDVRDWKVEWAQRNLKESGPSKQNIVPILYRPFDVRYTYYTGKSRGFHCMPRAEVMRHLLAGENIALCTNRQVNAEFHHVFCAKSIVDYCGVSLATKERTYVFPLCLYPTEVQGAMWEHGERRPNLSPAFLKALAEKLNLPQTNPHGLPEGIMPEDIFHYTYAVFHSPTYRTRYAEFLKMDFPRLPLTGDLDLFRDLAELGKQLVALHLLDADAIRRAESPSLPDVDDETRRGRRHRPTPLARFAVAGSDVVEKVRYEILRCAQNDKVDGQNDDATARHSERSEESHIGRVYINKTQYFDNVPPEVWEFRVGGYQVCDKWLKDRKGRKLTFDDIQHYQRIVVALNETIRLMGEIDERIPEFPMS